MKYNSLFFKYKSSEKKHKIFKHFFKHSNGFNNVDHVELGLRNKNKIFGINLSGTNPVTWPQKMQPHLI